MQITFRFVVEKFPEFRTLKSLPQNVAAAQNDNISLEQFYMHYWTIFPRQAVKTLVNIARVEVSKIS